jgi:DNA polymerase III subunit delta
MFVAPESLRSHIERRGLAPGYLVFGEEPLQAAESADVVRAAARSEGISERLRFEIDAGFDWQQVRSGANELSLFAERRVIEIRLGARKPDKTGSAILAELVGRDDAQDILLVHADRLDRSAQKAIWFKAIDAAGVTVQVRQIDPSRLDSWIVRRARQHGLTMTPAAAELVAVRAEGNLLAAAQELDKLSLLVEQGQVDVDIVLGAMVDSARFDVFGLIDVTLSGDGAKAVRMLRGLREEGTEAVVIGWALNRELRNLSYMAVDLAADKPVQSVLNGHKVWRSRAGVVKQALARVSLARVTRLLRDSIALDRIIKGSLPGDPWDELEMLCLELAGKRQLRVQAKP